MSKQAPATLRSQSGAGFEFEDLISAWLQVKMLTGVQAPGIGGDGIQLQAQVSALHWHIDDLLLTTQGAAGINGRLAISAKGNLQVSAAGLPADFVKRAWSQWRDPKTPMNRSSDGLALVTRGIHRVFDPTWSEVKNACAGPDSALAMSRIRSNTRQSKIFDSVQKPDGNAPAVSEEETIELIRRLHVLPLDMQLAHSETESQSIALCRQILASGDSTEAQKLWRKLVSVATELRLRRGTITLDNLWLELRTEFDLRQHPNFARDWETLSNITSDYRTRIKTTLSSGYSIGRAEEKSKLETAISANAVTVVFGESGSGKSAIVKDVLDVQFGTWTQVWFGSEDLKTALSAARRGTLPLGHGLARILSATVNPKNVLVIDAAESIELPEFTVIRQLFETLISPTARVDASVWRIVVVTQRVHDTEAMLGGRHNALTEVGLLKHSDVKAVLEAFPSLRWLAAHDVNFPALTNLRALAWVVEAGAALGASASNLASLTAICDRLWNYWTGDRADVQALTMRLAEREASFERSFALSDLDPADAVTFNQRPAELPLRLNPRTNRIEFEHDLAADWARFQFLKQTSTNILQWARLAGNPLWTNSLRMLGQFLLRQAAVCGTAWDAAFEAAEGGELGLAGDILLDALSLDPEAERFITERIDLLLANDAKHFTRLLIRFHHIGTVPTGGVLETSSFSLYMEAQYRSIVIGRWPPILRFLIAHREKLSGLVSSAVAKVIQTWLMGTPRELGNGELTPFRRELAEIALAMARTVQVEKGHGVMYLTRGEPLLYTAPLAGAVDLPDEVGAWALELAGRRKVADEVIARITEALRQQAEQQAERLRTDPKYKAKHEARRQIPCSIGSSRERLPPWPLGANQRVDTDFQTACFKENGIQFLIRARPDVAAEVLLALIIEDEPERDYGSSRHEIDLGLDFALDCYPTAFWKSPFFPFLQIAPDVALKALIALVNFCTDRWIAGVMGRREEPSLGLALQMAEGEEKTFAGWWQVFDWTQSNSNHNGRLFCALDALERWLTLQLDASVDVTPHVEQILREGRSVAFIGLLVNVGKYGPSLFSGVLVPLLTNPYVFYWDQSRVANIGWKFDSFNWVRDGEAVFNIARDWTLAPHRKKSLLDVVVALLTDGAPLVARLQVLISRWSIPADPKAALEFKLLVAELNRDNYRRITNPETGAETLVFECPDSIRLEFQSREEENAKPLQYLLLPERCEKLLREQHAIDDSDAALLYSLLKECEGDTAIDEGAKTNCKLALAASLIVLAESWLTKTPQVKEDALAIVQAAVGDTASTVEEIRSNRMGNLRDELKFAAHAAMHLWMGDHDRDLEWEGSVLRLLTSGDDQAAETIVRIAYAHRRQLGSAWWRLLKAGVLWSGLLNLSPYHGEAENEARTWRLWLTRLRRFPLRGKDATVDDLEMERVSAGSERLAFIRRMRAFKSGEKLWRGEPEHQTGTGLDTHTLEILFHWLINGPGTGDWTNDINLAKQLWAYEAERAKGRAKEESGKYDLPSQLGYDLLQKLAEFSLAAPEAEARTIWEPVLRHGPLAHYALGHFIGCMFLRLSKGDDAGSFERIWRATVEYGLSADWNIRGVWFYGERLICDLLGFGNEEALRRLAPGAALRMRDVYERWAELHLGRDEECIKRFCYFLATDFGEPLRLDGLRWIAALFKTSKSSVGWARDRATDALIELVNASLNQNAQALYSDSQARQALVEIAAALATGNIPTALVLQERIKLLR